MKRSIASPLITMERPSSEHDPLTVKAAALAIFTELFTAGLPIDMVGAVVSMTIAFAAPNDPAVLGAGKVRLAATPVGVLIVPLFNDKAWSVV